MLLLLLFVGGVAYSDARYGSGDGPIVLNNLVCTGTETNIFDCVHDGIGVIGTCTHSDDAAVMCQEGECVCVHM